MSTEREQLIEAASKAMCDDSHGEGAWECREPMEEALYLSRARAAFAVFEKAHTPTDACEHVWMKGYADRCQRCWTIRDHACTPTDDEREALVALNEATTHPLNSYKALYDAAVLARRALARRTVQGEPSNALDGRGVLDAIRWLADARDQYSGEEIRSQTSSVRLVADIIDGTNRGTGWLPSWLWDAWSKRREALAGVMSVQGEPQHDESCGERCNHCTACGVAIVYGSRCPDHYLNRAQGEPEWEYGIRPLDDDVPLSVSPMPTYEAARVRADNIRGGWAIVRRRPAGPWVAVQAPEGEEKR